MPIVYFKDRFAEENECHISLRDRSFRFGDGIFETMLVVGGKVYDMPSHLDRLGQGLKAFRISLDIGNIPELCRQVVARNQLAQGYIRITVSRGVDEEGAAGYMTKGSTPYFVIQAVSKPYPAFKPVKLWLSTYRVSFHTPSKTNNALLYTLAMMEASDNSCDNALLLDTYGHICETASGNIFWIKDKTLFTPALTLPFVPGTMRKTILELWRGDLQEGHFTPDDLQSAEEIFMTNVGALIAPVVSVAPSGILLPLGACTNTLRQEIDRTIQQTS